MELRSGELMIKTIQVREGRLPINEGSVKSLMASIKEVGVVEPIIVCEPRQQLGIYLVAGANRLEACKRLKHKTIPSRIIRGNTPEIQRWCKLAEIDENLVRRELSAAQRSKLIAQRKAVYIEEHPETKHGGAPGKKGGGKQKGKDPNLRSFVKDTVKKTGRSKAAVERDARRGEKLEADILDRVQGTSLDKGVELDALIDMKPEAREVLISQAIAGKDVSAVEESEKAKPTPTPGFSKLEKAWLSFRKAWKSASEAARQKLCKETPDLPSILREMLQ